MDFAQISRNLPTFLRYQKRLVPGQQATSNIAVNVEFKILDNELGDKIPLPKFSTAGSCSFRLEDLTSKKKKVLQPDETFLFTTGFSIHIKDSKYAALILP
jgi:dUTP pyrophosphatase